ncbi:MAG: uracil-DNA glycosylase family protein [Alistipes sp.]
MTNDFSNKIEQHPLTPFLPVGAKMLMLGSFPPPHARWSMEFYYPNLQNDMWRIMGTLFYEDKNHFLTADKKHFDRERIIAFCTQKGVALYDTASEVIRLKDNASDNFLQVVREVDLAALLRQIPLCRTLVTTGEKATDTLCALTGCPAPAIGTSAQCAFAGHTLRLYRMPSSSRAYPKSVEWKAEFYRRMLLEIGIL